MSEEIEAAEVPAVEESGTIEESQELQPEAGTEIDSSVELSSEESQELRDQVEGAIEDGATQEEIESMVRQYTIKVNGKDYVQELDLSDEAAVIKQLQLAAAGQQAMQKSSQMEREYNDALKRLQDNPSEFLEELGIDTLGLSEARLKKEIERQSLSPDELARQEMQKELEEMRSEVERTRKEKEDADFIKLQQEQATLIENDIMTAIDESGLPPEPDVIRKIADAMMWAEDNGFENVSAKDVIPTVKSEMERSFKNYAKNAYKDNTDALKALLGDDIMDKMRQQRVESIKNVNNVNNLKKASSKVQAPTKEEPRKKQKLSDFMR